MIGQRQHDPIQLDAEDVLPHQDRQAERGPQREHDGTDDHHGGDQASGDEDHDEQDERHRGHRDDHQVVCDPSWMSLYVAAVPAT